MSYEVIFTSAFKHGLATLPHEVYPIVDRQIAWLANDPFAKNSNALRLKNAPRTFRVRIGSHVRMMYRVLSKQRRVEIIYIGPRENFYRPTISHGKPLTPQQIEELRASLATEQGNAGDCEADYKPHTNADSPGLVEELDWISEDELFFLQIPSESRPAILMAGSVEDLLKSDLDPSIKARIEDYWTNPSPTQVEKLYSLSGGQDARTIAQQPLSQFLIALDPEQKDALQKIRSEGPYLLKGSAGTGKSLVGLYHIRDLITARAGESLFDLSRATFGVITYTNTLVDANQALLRGITPEIAHAGIRCCTLDKIVYDLVQTALGRPPNALSTEGISSWIRSFIQPMLPKESEEILARLGPDYVAEEIEQVILGNGLESLPEYLNLERRGRKRGLRETERIELWRIYESFMELAAKRSVQTFEQWRVIALRHLKAHPEHPRFASLFVDEAQDFSKVARQLCLELVSDPKHLVLASDTGQSIYTVPLSWRQSDARFDFRRRRPIMLERSYRATWQIGQSIAPLRSDPGDDDDRSANASPVFSGPMPRWIEAPQSGHVEVVCREIKDLVESSHSAVNPGQVAVIVRDSNRAARYKDALTSCGISSFVVEKRAPLRIDGAHVHLVTAHSSKGLGFPIVFVPDLHEDVYPWRMLTDKAKDPQQREQVEEAEQRLLYVALSRASHRLFMVVDPSNPSPFVGKLDRSAHWS